MLQELLHVYLPVNRWQTLHDALELVARGVQEARSIDPEDVLDAVRLAEPHPAHSARELIHLANCQRRGIRHIRTFDRALGAAFAES